MLAAACCSSALASRDGVVAGAIARESVAAAPEISAQAAWDGTASGAIAHESVAAPSGDPRGQTVDAPEAKAHVGESYLSGTVETEVGNAHVGDDDHPGIVEHERMEMPWLRMAVNPKDGNLAAAVAENKKLWEQKQARSNGTQVKAADASGACDKYQKGVTYQIPYVDACPYFTQEGWILDSFKFLGGGGFGCAFSVQGCDRKNWVVKTQKRSDMAAMEVRLMGGLNNINLLKMIGTGVTQSHTSMLMEVADGGDLDGKQAKMGEATQWMLQLTLGIKYMHDQGLVHRDIKPENTMLVGNDAKVADFGLVCAKGATHLTQGVTPCQGVAGTPVFMSPQTVIRGEIDKADDMWAIGVTMFNIFLGGCMPWWTSPAGINRYGGDWFSMLGGRFYQVELSRRFSVWEPMPHRHGVKCPIPIQNVDQHLQSIINGLLMWNPGQRWTALQAAQSIRDLALKYNDLGIINNIWNSQNSGSSAQPPCCMMPRPPYVEAK